MRGLRYTPSRPDFACYHQCWCVAFVRRSAENCVFHGRDDFMLNLGLFQHFQIWRKAAGESSPPQSRRAAAGSTPTNVSATSTRGGGGRVNRECYARHLSCARFRGAAHSEARAVLDAVCVPLAALSQHLRPDAAAHGPQVSAQRPLCADRLAARRGVAVGPGRRRRRSAQVLHGVCDTQRKPFRFFM